MPLENAQKNHSNVALVAKLGRSIPSRKLRIKLRPYSDSE
jgi:hypothetical protein